MAVIRNMSMWLHGLSWVRNMLFSNNR